MGSTKKKNGGKKRNTNDGGKITVEVELTPEEKSKFKWRII